VARTPKLPSERDWERSVVLEPRPAPRVPELISDGGGLPFAPAAFGRPPGRLDPADPAVGALLAQISRRTASKGASRLPWRRATAAPTLPEAPPSLDGWRLLARTEEEVLFGRCRPPQLLTVAVRRDGRGGTWTCLGSSAARPLRTTRDGIRSSRWRLDPTREPAPEDAVLRVLVTEQTFSAGQRADSRVLSPDLYVDSEELVLTMFVTPLPGFQTRSPNPETPVRVKLPHRVGSRRLIDGGVYARAPGDTPPAGAGAGQ
jgi:hypothetical protein